VPTANACRQTRSILLRAPSRRVRCLRIRVIDTEPVSRALKLPADVRLTAEPPHITVQDVRGITVGPTVRRIKVDENAKLFDICGVNPETYLKEK
jgi:hypothetical protein